MEIKNVDVDNKDVQQSLSEDLDTIIDDMAFCKGFENEFNSNLNKQKDIQTNKVLK